MDVSALMSCSPIVSSPETRFSEVWTLIFEKRISGVPIVDRHNRLLGIISEEDLIEKLYPSYSDFFFDPSLSRDYEAMEKSFVNVSSLKAKDFMNKNVYTTTEETPIMKAASAMLVYKVNCLPVVREKANQKILVGILCKGDIFGHLLKLHSKKKLSEAQ